MRTPDCQPACDGGVLCMDLLERPVRGSQIVLDVLPACCSLVPVLYRGIFTTDACEAAIADLRANGSKAAPGFMKPEGIICFHVAGNFGFKKTLEKDDVPKALQAHNEKGQR